MSTPQQEMHVRLIGRQQEKMEGWQIHLLKEFFNITRLHHPATLGSFAWSCAPIRVKWLHQHNARNLGGGWVTPGDIARDYLALKYPNRKMGITTEQWEKCVKDVPSAPIYCTPCHMDQGCYFDLTGAYWQIVRAVGWDVHYNPGKWLAVNSRMIDFPYPDEKLARNCLVSVGLVSPVRLWTGSKIISKNKPNRFVNYVLWRLVMDVLNGVASDCVQAGAQYVYTDGYLVDDRHAAAVEQVLQAWGLLYSVKHQGETQIKSVNRYRCGDYQTQDYARGFRVRAMSKLYAAPEGLREDYAMFAEHARKEWLWLGEEKS